MEHRAQVSLPESQLRWLSDRARSCGFSSPEDYLSALIRRDQALNDPHEAPSGPHREEAAAELNRVMRRISEHFEDVPPKELDAEIDRACDAVRRGS
jgi:hypothetical protein